MATGGEKARLREQALAARRALTGDEVRAKSAAIARHLETIPCFRHARALLTYAASKDNEVDTLPIIAGALARKLPVFVPIMAPRRALCWSHLRAIEHLRPGLFGILEPPLEHRRYTNIPQPRVCLVPGLAFTRDGHRLGYGGGYFDRFLEQFTGISIGLAFSDQLVEALPLNEHDRAVDFVVTEDRVLKNNPPS